MFEFGSYTSKIGHSGEDCPWLTFPTWVGYQDKPGAPVTTPKGLRDDDDEGSEYKSGPQFKRKKPCRIGDTEISFWQEGLDLRNPMKECLGTSRGYPEDLC